MSGAKVDVRGILERAGADTNAPEGSQGWALAQVELALARLIVASEDLLPRNLCLDNPNVPDSTEVDLIATLGELRAFAAALRRIGATP